MAGDHEIGKARIRVEVDGSKVKPELESLRTDVEQSTASAGQSINKNIGGGLSRAGAAASKLQAAVSKVLIPAAVVSSLAAVVVKFREAAREAERFRDSLKDVGRDAQSRLAGFNATTDVMRAQAELAARQATERERITDAIDEAIAAESNLLSQTKNIVAGLFTDAPTTAAEKAKLAQKELAKLSRLQAQEARILDKQLDEDRKRRNQETADAIQAQNRDIETQLLSGLERVEAQRVRAIEDTEAELDAADDDRVRSMLRRRLELINALAASESQAIKDAKAEEIKAEQDRKQREEEARRDRERRDIESAERSARAQADALAKAMTAALDRIGDRVDALNDDTSQTLNALLRRVEVLVDNQGI